MKLATYKDGSRDGQLVVVSRDLATAHYATGIAGRLQQALDDWNFIAPQLQDLYVALNQGRARHAFPFEAARCMAPLPRAYRWVVANAYRSHLEPLQPRASGAVGLLRQAAQILDHGGVGAIPTDSCYALACHLDDKAAVDRIRAIRRSRAHATRSARPNALNTASIL